MFGTARVKLGTSDDRVGCDTPGGCERVVS